MPVETATYIHDLNAADPLHTDGLNQADAHIRLIKTVLQSTFPNLTGPVNATPAQINQATGASTTPGAMEVASAATAGASLILDPIAGSGAVKLAADAPAGSDGQLDIIINDKTNANPTTALSISRNGTLTTPSTGGINAGSIQKNGFELLPKGFIGFWSGSAASIPGGWQLCNGTNGTPDLRNRFIIAAGGSYAVGQVGGAASSAAVTDAQGAHAHTGVTTTNGPWGMSGSSDAQGNHSHGGATGVGGSHAHVVPATTAFVAPGSTGITIDDGNTLSAGDHNHAIGFDGNHAHNIFVSNVPAHNHGIVVDGNHAHNVSVTTLPPFYALCMIMKMF